VEAIARVLSGECYEDKPHDKRLVAEVILNRVSNERWGDTVIEVVTQKSQFHGYWNPSRDISDNDREIAAQALRDWYANDCAALSKYLFFEAGPNRENVFRENY
jgi:spore germination cell wall hydrolase CwlJ-like protein